MAGFECSWNPGGGFLIKIVCEKAEVKTLCMTGVTLYGIYTTSQLLARAIDGIVNKAFGGYRNDQGMEDIRPGSLHVKLLCFTDERFLEVWADYESGRIKERLQEGFTQSGIELEGLIIEIENLEEVNQTKTDIEIRRSLGGQKASKTEDEVNKKLNEIKENVDEIKENQLKFEAIVNANFKKFKQEIIHELTVTSRREGEKPQEIIVIGGNDKELTPLPSVEKGVLGKDGIVWAALPPLTVPRSFASSVVIGHEVFAVGGGTDSIETLCVDQLPLQWAMSKAVLPFSLYGHSSVVYQGKLIVIGGYNNSNGTFSDAIYEILLTPPHTSKLLGKLPKPIGYHGAELVDDEIFLFGGKNEGKLYDDILVYDLIKNECRKVSKLPYPLRYMSTVQLKDKVILIGGEEQTDTPLKGVIMYDTKLGKCSDLPSMNHARRGCSAVISGDVVLVFGGYGMKGKQKSAECYDMSQRIWKKSSNMKEARGHCTAVVCPQL